MRAELRRLYQILKQNVSFVTPLYDAAAETIKKGDRLMDDRAVLVVIMTDSQENASRRYNRQEVFKLIEEREKQGWLFAYLGANQDAYVEGRMIGVATGSTINYGFPARRGVRGMVLL